jgi:hypothetical protein
MKTPDRVTQLWPDDSTGPFLLVLHLAMVKDRIECVGVELRSFLMEGEPDTERYWGVLPIVTDEMPESGGMQMMRVVDGKFAIIEYMDAGGGYITTRSGRQFIRAEPVTTSDLRNVNLGGLVVAARSLAVTALEGLAAGAKADDTARQELIEKARRYAQDSRRGRGRKGLPVEHYVEVADVYRAAHTRGDHPTQAVQLHFGVSKSTAAKKVARARELDLLGPTKKGIAGEIEPGGRWND